MIVESTWGATIVQTRNKLIDLYEGIKKYEEIVEKQEETKKKIREEIEKAKKELEVAKNLTKLEKMKKQMNLTVLEISEQEISYSNYKESQEEILKTIKEIECSIYFSIRFNTTCYPSFEIKHNILNIKNIKKIYSEEYIKKHQDSIKNGSKYVLDCLKPIYEYYQKTSEILKNHEEKLDMLEELIDEMAAEAIREDMKKNNIVLPEFVKGMKYFKYEDEE